MAIPILQNKNKMKKQDEETLMANPGAVKDGTFAIYDTKTKIFEVKSI